MTVGPTRRRKKKARQRRRNPLVSPRTILTIRKGNGVTLRYVGGVRFSNQGRAVLFPTRADALRTWNELKKQFSILRGYTAKPIS